MRSIGYTLQGRRQAVRHQVLILACVGSNPAAPAIFILIQVTLSRQVLRVSKMMVFTGNANPDLARRIVRQLHIPLGDASVGKFSDGEIMIEINENVRGKDVFLIQPTCAPTNDNLMELVVMADAFRRSSATRITAVILSLIHI